MKKYTNILWMKRLALIALSMIAAPVGAQSIGAAYPLACRDEVRTLGYSIATRVGTAMLTLPVLDRGFGDGHRPADIEVSRYACGGVASVPIITIDDHATWSGFPPPSMLYPELRATQEGRTVTLVSVAVRTGRRILPGNIGEIGISGLATSLAALEVPSGDMDLNRPFVLTVVDPYDPAHFTTINVPGFEPTPATYPNAYGPRVISGRYAGNYFDPARPGEGIIVEIGDVPGQARMHFLQFSWFTYDNFGKPFWISGGGNFTDGDRHLHMPAAFRGGGRFAGAQAATALTTWGSVDMEFTDCDTLVFSFSGGSPAFPPNVPRGMAQLQWKRLTGISGYSCN